VLPFAEALILPGEFHVRTAGREKPAELAECSSKSAFLSGLFAGLLALMLPGLLSLLLLLLCPPCCAAAGLCYPTSYSNSKNNLAWRLRLRKRWRDELPNEWRLRAKFLDAVSMN
jgi:hypothetical protein